MSKSWKGLETAEMTFKVIRNGAILYDTCDFLLVFHCNYISILYRFLDISTYFPKF